RDPELGGDAVEGLRRRGGDRLDVDPHPVHVFEPLLDRTELHAVALGLFAVDLPCALVGEMVTRLPVHRETGLLDHFLGLRSQHMAMDVDREPFAAGMHRPRKTAGDLRSFGQAGEQHPTFSSTTCRVVPTLAPVTY